MFARAITRYDRSMSRLLLALLVTSALASPASADIAIGTVGPMNGPLQLFGEEMKAGAARAVADIDAEGGVLGQKLTLEVGDDNCDGAQATAVANQMIGKNIVFMAGHFCSFASMPAAPVYAQAKIVQISPASPHPAFTDQRAGPGVFRLCGRDDDQGKVAGTFLAKHFADKRIAFADDRSPYGKGLAEATKKAMNDAGKKEEFSETYEAGARDFNELVSRLKDANIDVLYIGGYHPDAALIAKEMRDQGLHTVIVGGDDLLTEDYWRTAGDAADGTLLTFPPDPRRNPEAARVVAAFRQSGNEPQGYTLCTYAAVQVWAAAATLAGSIDFDKVTAALAKGTFKTVLGDIRFNQKGDATRAGYAVYIWHNGKCDMLKM
jgi:branched-chain amino acid transport system substrate-binding protein